MTDECAHARPPVIALNKFFCFKVSGMTGGRVIVMKGKNAVSKGSGDIGSIPVEERSVLKFPIRKGRFHRGSVKAIKGLLGGEDDRVGERVCRFQRSCKVIIDKASKERVG
jgi:hypothetical protein